MTQVQQHRLEEIRKRLVSIDGRESNFLKIELVFYEAMETARMNEDDPGSDKLLYALKDLQAGAYQDTKKMFKKSSQREQVIRRFMSRLKTILATAIKEASVSSSLMHHPTAS